MREADIDDDLSVDDLSIDDLSIDDLSIDDKSTAECSQSLKLSPLTSSESQH